MVFWVLHQLGVFHSGCWGHKLFFALCELWGFLFSVFGSFFIHIHWLYSVDDWKGVLCRSLTSFLLFCILLWKLIALVSQLYLFNIGILMGFSWVLLADWKFLQAFVFSFSEIIVLYCLMSKGIKSIVFIYIFPSVIVILVMSINLVHYCALARWRNAGFIFYPNRLFSIPIGFACLA